jgi:integration host factor subunit beta
LATKNSELLRKLANNYPNFYKKDLKKLIEIFLNEIKNSLKRHERVELRDIFTLETKLQKAKYARNPKTNERIFVSEKYSVIFKTSKFWNKKLNEEK